MAQELVDPVPVFHEAVELRVALARTGIRQYLVADRLGISEGKLSKLLTGRDELSPEMAERIHAAINDLAAA